MIKNIIFDIGNVLIRFDWRSYLHQYGFAPEKEAVIANAVFLNPVWKELDRAIWTIAEIEEGFASAAPQYRDDILTVFRNSGQAAAKQDYAIPWIQSLKLR
jgi:putative hydrolase of the HAD superfamily